jgi:DNA-3-methyladenine glycosylase
MKPLSEDFYSRPTVTVARELLGMRLVRILDGVRVAGIITETEAYVGETDLASHARAGRTVRTRFMYGPPGRAYIYFIYGMHWCFNIVTEADAFPAAVLVRAVETVEGIGVVESRRGKAKRADWTLAFGIDSALNGADLTTTESGLWVEPDEPVANERVTIGPRVGLYNVPEPWKSMPWRFLVRQKNRV